MKTSLQKWLKMARLHWFWTALAALTLLTAFTRFYQLGTVPQGLSWDEAAIGYNGYAVATTLRDEWLELLPVSFKSFGDYKAPLAIYVTGIFTTLLGLKPWVIRLPFALSGVVGVTGMVLATRELLRYFKVKVRDNNWTVDVMSLVAGLVLATSPWHLHFSRLAFESGMALSLIIWGLYFWFKFVTQKKQHQILLSLGFFAASMYTYHSPKVVVPLLGLVLTAFCWSRLQQVKTKLIIGLSFGCLVVIPLLFNSLLGEGAARLGQATLKAENFPFVVTQQLLTHLDPVFLVRGFTPNLRHGDGAWGVLLPTVFALFLVGIMVLPFPLGARNRRWGIFCLGWIIIGLFPAAIGVDVPHANRALLALPGFIWLSLIGLEACVAWALTLGQSIKGTHQETHLVEKSLVGTLLLVHSLFFIAYQHHYYSVFAAESGAAFQAQYLEVFKYLETVETDPKINQIVFSNQYGSAYIFGLVSKKSSPFEHQYGGLIKYKFVEHVNAGHLAEEKTVVVATSLDDIPFDIADKSFYDAGGHLRFSVFLEK